MKTVVYYADWDDGAELLSIRAHADKIAIPEQAGERKVSRIGAYAFSGSEPPKKYRRAPGAVKEQTIEDSFLDAARENGPERLCGSRLTAVTIPESVSEIGDYAFYGCRSLKSFGFTGSLKRLGSGVFMGCRSLDELCYRDEGSGMSALRQVLSELRQAVTVHIIADHGSSAVVFPAYFEMSVENVPARIFEVHTNGTGYMYRQCIQDSGIDYKAYDALFKTAAAQDPPGVLVDLAYSRLCCPLELSKPARDEYTAFFSRRACDIAGAVLDRDNTQMLEFLLSNGCFDGRTEPPSDFRLAAERAAQKGGADGAGDFYMASLGEGFSADPSAGRESLEAGDAIDVLLEHARSRHDTAAVSLIMDRRRSLKGTSRKTFIL